MNWSEEKVNLLIEEYGKRTFLYTIKNVDYRNRMKKKIAHYGPAAGDYW